MGEADLGDLGHKREGDKRAGKGIPAGFTKGEEGVVRVEIVRRRINSL